MSLWLEPAVFPVLLDWSPQILEDTVRNLLADARSTPEKAELIVTLNVRHFPAVVLEPLGI